TADGTSTETVFYNSAAMSNISRLQLTFSDTRLYNLPELPFQTVTILIPLPSKFGSFGFGYTQFGTEIYQEKQLVISQGIKVLDSPYISVGYALKQYYLKIQYSNSMLTYGLDTSLFCQPAKKLTVGLNITNLNRPSVGKSAEKLAQYIQAGAKYQPVEYFAVSMDIVREQNYLADTELRVGLEFFGGNHLTLRAGMLPAPAVNYSFGFGINLEIFAVDYGYFAHPYLEAQHMFSLSLKIPVNFFKWYKEEIKPKVIPEEVPVEEELPPPTIYE
ncbi:MAG: hypothetical protein QME68_08360, partial [Elusimicrobiota bacterium]|nr:hypothetical protein [Elusimicrobiota bacterium]